jgi:hypothetical protein
MPEPYPAVALGTRPPAVGHRYLSGLFRHVGLLLELEDPCALQSGAWVAGEWVVMLYDDDLDDGVYILIDVGCIGQGVDAGESLRILMDVNLELSAQRGESFCLDSRSQRVVFRAFLPEGLFTPEIVARDILRYVDLIRELRAQALHLER